MAPADNPSQSNDNSIGNHGGISSTDASTLIPPYWSRRRYESYCSVENTKPPPINLVDHTEGPLEPNSPVWAHGVSVDDHVLVTGNVPSIGNFVVWHCKIDTLDVSHSFFILISHSRSCGAPQDQH